MIEIETVTEQREVELCTAIICDKCGKRITPDDWIDWQEALQIRFTGGFGSVFGDEMSFRCDLCQHCVKDVLGDYIKDVTPEWEP